MVSAAKSHGLGRLTWRRCLLLAGILLFAGIAFLFLAAVIYPSIGAHGADTLRSIIGDPAVAQLETWIFQIEDSINQVKYNLGFAKPAAPWQVPSSPLAIETAMPSPTPTTGRTISPTPSPTHQVTPLPSPTLTRTMTPMPTLWRPAAAHALGSLEGEAVWQAYIKDEHGRAVAYRTFIQPDPSRPYSVVAVVAFDLDRTRLNFILGYDEPSLKGGPKGNGLIPEADAMPNVLLATFNGGFKAEHGQYGAMSAGVMAIPARKDLATIAIFKDGSVKIGAYGKEITSLDNTIAWRQNCSLVIENGQINPLVNDDSAQYWGANLNGETVIWRSGLGISPDGKTLYYFAGPSLRMRVLAAAMQAVNVKAGLQLDINNYWVHFVAVRYAEGKALPEPLFPNEMKYDAGRYLTRYSRDFFYVALRETPAP
jgi:hypothetical protein